ncbi:YciI family protein [Amycolatopsis sp. CA-230715]|uniref:YciI family protein n=1 Tax=Amycolatopsis sp. CA-230715 TaxID=2745196 RepID=UPI001C01023D|nr:YciI family protein [Amycolatopsis sp. CA-230715]QWF84717.1 hypothetical protein HUW46_08169 [Amycolatopsis sp. CA-230715]
MKYLVLIYSNPTTWAHPSFLHHEGSTEDERKAMMAQFEELMGEIAESGELVDGQPLAAPALTKTIRARADGLQTVDGPFAESKEQLAGFFVIDCETPERAAEIAGRLPDTRFGAVELRPIMSGSGMEM